MMTCRWSREKPDESSVARSLVTALIPVVPGQEAGEQQASEAVWAWGDARLGLDECQDAPLARRSERAYELCAGD
ncbi:hypothetical protein MHYP_G00192630 [Metynnis hypsauchen]